MKYSVYGLLFFLLTACGACVAQSQQPSLGDLARQSREEKKPVKTFTNEDVATASPAAPNVKAPDASAPAAAKPSDKTAATVQADSKAEIKKKDDGKATQTKDSPEVAELKNKISSYKEQLDGWKRSAKRYQDLLAGESSDFRRQMYQDALQGDQQNVQMFQDKVDEAQADLIKAEKNAQPGH